jgi:Zn-dependent protease
MNHIGSIIQSITVWILPVLLAVTLHEAAHGYAALALGDDTARRMGRLSLNPVRHIDPFGTIILPALMLVLGGVVFGWAKPVPVNFGKLKAQRLGMMAVAAAGPAMNMALALAAAWGLTVLPAIPAYGRDWLVLNLQNALYINVLLAVFNMLPVPPLDGGRVVGGLLPRRLAMRWARLDEIGLLLIVAALFLLPMIGRGLHLNIDIFGWLVNGPVEWLVGMVARMVGM